MNELFEQIYRAIVDNVCRDYSFMSKLSPGNPNRDYIDGKATGQLQALFTLALYLEVNQETLHEIRSLAGL